MIDELIFVKIYYVNNNEVTESKVNEVHREMSKANSDGKLRSAKQSVGAKIADVITEFLSSTHDQNLMNTRDTSPILCPGKASITNIK